MVDQEDHEIIDMPVHFSLASPMFFHSFIITGNNLKWAHRKVAPLLCVLFLPLMALLSPGCAGRQLGELRGKVEDLPPRIELKTVPFYSQKAFQCGPAALYWGLLVLSPRDLPATAREKPYLQAVLGLEKPHQWRGAVQGYETALRRWRGSLGALMGLGNSLYALGDLTKAETAFREASRLHPSSGAGFNNLAQVLWEQDRAEEALWAAQRAVALGGPQSAVYRGTLKEIESGKP